MTGGDVRFRGQSGPPVGLYNPLIHNIFFARRYFPPDIIHHAVWLYARFTLSYRDLEDLLAESGLS